MPGQQSGVRSSGSTVATSVAFDANNTLSLTGVNQVALFNGAGFTFTFDALGNLALSGQGAASHPALTVGGQTEGLYQPGAGRLGFGTNGGGRWEMNGSGHFLAALDNTYDIGAAAATRPRTIYAGTDVWAGSGFRVGNGSTTTLLISIASSLARFLAAGTTHGYSFQPNGTVATSGALQYMKVTPEANTGQTLSTEINGFSWDAFTRQWATGAIASQREFALFAPTYAFVGASIITTAATLYVSGAPIAGANATITTGHAAWFGAKIRVDAAVALGGGAAPTLGTIGGTGPAAAAQNEWLEIHTQNGKRFVPVWA